MDDFPCNAIDRNGQIACASFFYDVWQDNYIQAEILLSNGYEYYPTWQLSVTAAGGLALESVCCLRSGHAPLRCSSKI